MSSVATRVLQLQGEEFESPFLSELVKVLPLNYPCLGIIFFFHINMYKVNRLHILYIFLYTLVAYRPGTDNTNLINTENAVPIKAENNANIKYNVAVYLAWVERNHLSIIQKWTNDEMSPFIIYNKNIN